MSYVTRENILPELACTIVVPFELSLAKCVSGAEVFLFVETRDWNEHCIGRCDDSGLVLLLKSVQSVNHSLVPIITRAPALGIKVKSLINL